MSLVFPDDTQRHVIVGTTGSGKTTFGAWCLSMRRYDKMPWLLIDFKHDPLIEKIPRLEEIGVRDRIPSQPGLYVVRPLPGEIDDGDVTELLFRVWEKERTGLFFDEGYMIPRLDKGLRTVLTQGRSKQIPIISLSQRPAFISPFLLSESEFKTVFYLDHPADIDRMNEWMPYCDPSTLPDHYSYWYGRKGRQFATLAPCPNEAEILNRFDARRVPRRSWLHRLVA